MKTIKVIRAATASSSVDQFLRGQLRFLNKEYEVYGLAGDSTFISQIEKREGVPVIHVPIQRDINLFSDLLSLVRMVRLFHKMKPTIVHSLTPKAGLLCMIASYIVGVPVRLHTFTGLIFPSKTGVLQKVLIWMDRLLCACATAVFPEGEGVKQDLLNYKITSKPLKVLGNGNINGVDFNYYDELLYPPSRQEEIRNKFNISLSDTVFAFIGRLVKDKGVVELINSFKKVEDSNPNVKLILLGSYEPKLDPLPKDILDYIEVNRNILDMGYQEDVRSFIAASDVLVFPSYREGFPNVPLQFGAFKKAMVLSDIYGCNEIVEDKKSGLLVPKQSEHYLVDAMLLLMENIEYRQQLGDAAYKFILAKFDQKLVWSELQNEYRRVLNDINK
jgi:glycosyltransferase involved in cell wall biosynthesis